MPLFYMHIQDDTYAVDREGVEFPDLAAARDEAIGGLREILARGVLTGRLFTDGYITIADEFGEPLATVTCNDALTIARRLNS
jgi:hypothetical protein